MKPLDQPQDLRAFYQDRTVVDEYLRRRTGQPLNGVLHRSEVGFLDDVVHDRQPRRVLEIAPGPARLTAEIDYRGCGVAIDASPGMLAAARDRLRARPGRWLVAQGDAFSLPLLDGSVDFVYTLKFIRHFQLADRRRLYAEVRRVLAAGGVFAMDAQNRAVSLPHRHRKGIEKYPIYDVLYAPDELRSEMEAEGFRVVRMQGILQHFSLQMRLNRLRRFGWDGIAGKLIRLLERVPGGDPSTWMVLAEVAR